MKTLSLLQLLILGTCALAAEEHEMDRHPTAKFHKALDKLEDDYITGMRMLAEKAAEARIYQIDPNPSEADLLRDYPENEFFVFSTTGGKSVYQVQKTSDPEEDPEKIVAWARAVLPPEDHALDMCVPTPGFAIRFLNSDGSTIYQTTICLECHSAAMEFPRYSGRIGIDVERMKNLLKDQGFNPEESNTEVDGGKPDTRPESEPQGSDKPQPESEGLSQ